TVQRLVQGIFVLDQAQERGLFSRDERFPGRVFFFSHLYTALTRAEYRTFLGLPERWRDVPPLCQRRTQSRRRTCPNSRSYLTGSMDRRTTTSRRLSTRRTRM